MMSQNTMRAIRFHQYGGPEVLRYEDVPRPNPQTGEALVRVYAASINAMDWKIRSGFMDKMLPVLLPFIPGGDLAGVVEALGAGVSALQVGQEVYGVQGGIPPGPMRGGAYAEYAAVPVDALALKPTTLGFVQAASIPIVAMTAWQGLFDMGGLTAGQTVLIHGAAGGVGMFAVQFARAKAARVIATASAEDADFLRTLGADQVIDYQTQRFEEQVSGVDLVLDLIGGDTQARSWQTLRPDGILVATPGPPDQEAAKQHGVRAAMVMVQPNTTLLGQIGALLERGQVKTLVGATYPLSEAAQGQERSQHGHVRGKIVLTVA